MNKLINGDCLTELKKISDCSIDLVYLDPPFYTQRKQILKKKKDKELKIYEFEDSWESIEDYLQLQLNFRKMMNH